MTIDLTIVNIMFCFVIVYRLAEVGKLAIPKVDEKYETGQFFLHRVFGYRGVILFPWRAKIYDRNMYMAPYADSVNDENPTTIPTDTETTKGTILSTNAKTDESGGGGGGAGAKQKAKNTRKIETDDSMRNDGKKEVTVDVQTYYQVLIDSRDCPHVVCYCSRFFSIIEYSLMNC